VADETTCSECGIAPAGPLRPHGKSFEDCADCQRLGWIGHPRCESQREVEKFLIEHREDIEVIAQIADQNADYSYDDWALICVPLKGRNRRDSFYLLNTSGCSCPSPSETWGVHTGPTNLGVIQAEVAKSVDYSVPFRQRAEFDAAIEKALATL
jgi:hypothetical protein